MPAGAATSSEDGGSGNGCNGFSNGSCNGFGPNRGIPGLAFGGILLPSESGGTGAAKITLAVSGMVCSRCSVLVAAAINSAVDSMGVSTGDVQIDVDVESERAELVGKPSVLNVLRVRAPELIAAVLATGYTCALLNHSPLADGLPNGLAQISPFTSAASAVQPGR